MTIKLEHPYYMVDREDLPCLDFNKEIVHPGANKWFPNGAVGLRVDDDFWIMAVLPYSFKDTPTEELVLKLWPGLTDYEIMPTDEVFPDTDKE